MGFRNYNISYYILLDKNAILPVTYSPRALVLSLYVKVLEYGTYVPVPTPSFAISFLPGIHQFPL